MPLTIFDEAYDLFDFMQHSHLLEQSFLMAFTVKEFVKPVSIKNSRSSRFSLAYVLIEFDHRANRDFV